VLLTMGGELEGHIQGLLLNSKVKQSDSRNPIEITKSYSPGHL
jgi:hypothetical protein